MTHHLKIQNSYIITKIREKGNYGISNTSILVQERHILYHSRLEKREKQIPTCRYVDFTLELETNVEILVQEVVYFCCYKAFKASIILN